jgi:ubiquinone/menaquinone biosynthesis C-methylase UbiE
MSNTELNRDVASIWDANAEWWDEKTGEGDNSQRTMIRPAMEKLLDLRPGDTVLEIACGNGSFARRMISLGASKVIAFDFSAKFIERARARTAEAGLSDKIELYVLDATDEAALLRLGGPFDAAVANMALMDMSEIDPLMRALSRLLRPGGRFVFSVTHPCFNHTGISRFIEEITSEDGRLIETLGIKITQYGSFGEGTPKLGIAIPGQPQSQYYFERTLSGLSGAGFRAGLLLDGLEEPTFGPEWQANRAMSWANFTEIPPFMIARMRVLATAQGEDK